MGILDSLDSARDSAKGGVDSVRKAVGKPSIRENTNIVITTLGKGKIERFDSSRRGWTVLAKLSELSPSTPRELANETGIGVEKVLLICESLESKGYLKRAGATE